MGGAGRSGPGAGERARTVLACAPVIEVETADGRSDRVAVHGVDPDGSLVLLVPDGGPLGARSVRTGIRCVVQAARVTSVPTPDRVVDRVAVRGHLRLHPDVPAGMETLLTGRNGLGSDAPDTLRVDESVLLCVDVRGVTIDDHPVALYEYAAAMCDPYYAVGDGMVSHLATAHPDVVLALAALIGDPVVGGAYSITPIGIDRFGITLQVRAAARVRPVRLDFPAPVCGAHQLRHAMRELYWRATRASAHGHGRQ